MNTEFETIKNRLLLDQALSPDEAQTLQDSPELREFKDALDLALYQPATDDSEPNELVDARILGYAREQAAQRKEGGGLAVIHRFGVWHWAAGAMAACLVVAVTHSVWQRTHDAAEPTPMVAEQPVDGPALASAGDPQPLVPDQRLTAAPAAPVDAMSWDAVDLEREMFALQSALVVDLDQETTAGAVSDMLGGS